MQSAWRFSLIGRHSCKLVNRPPFARIQYLFVDGFGILSYVVFTQAQLGFAHVAKEA